MKFLRFADLKDREIVRNWTTLLRLIKQEGFPPAAFALAHRRVVGQKPRLMRGLKAAA